MTEYQIEQNLLRGLLAVRMGAARPSTVVEATRESFENPGVTFSAALSRLAGLSPDTDERLSALVRFNLEEHRDNPATCLLEVGTLDLVMGGLLAIPDPDLQKCLESLDRMGSDTLPISARSRQGQGQGSQAPVDDPSATIAFPSAGGSVSAAEVTMAIPAAPSSNASAAEATMAIPAAPSPSASAAEATMAIPSAPSPGISGADFHLAGSGLPNASPEATQPMHRASAAGPASADARGIATTIVDPNATQMYGSGAGDEPGGAGHAATGLWASGYDNLGERTEREARLAGGPFTRGDGASLASPAAARRFRVIRPHARGGLGEIFLANDSELNREVALKEIKERFAGHPENQARFKFEAEVTGGLEHPGIVPIYGMGHYPDGRPYYAMRFIRGETFKACIDDYHQDKTSTPTDLALKFHKLLRRFIDVCNAMEYAHARSILHRDLKPENIMLGPYGETLVVDWGLAKVVGESDIKTTSTEKPLRPMSGNASMTQVGTAVGTPAYMSPEQAGGEIDRLGPGTDIYSLGGILYSILTGKTAVGGSTLFEILIKVRNGEVTPPRNLKADVPKPLEAIVLKAMALKPEDRYLSARALAEDVEHYLADEPVSVYQEPFLVKCARWARRHQTAVAASGALLLTGICVSTVAAVLINQERVKTEANYRLARKAVEDMLTEVGAVELADVPQMEVVRAKILERAKTFYEKFIEEHRDDPKLKEDMGRALGRLGEIDRMLGRFNNAENALNQARGVLNELLAVEPENREAKRALARSNNARGVLYRSTGRYLDAEKAFSEALKIQEELVRLDSTNADDRQALDDTRYQRGALLARLPGRSEEEEAAYRESIADQEKLVAARKDKPDYKRELARYQNNLGRRLRSANQLAEAEKTFRDASVVLDDLVKTVPKDTGNRHQLARALSNLGNVLAAAPGKAADAETAIGRARDIQSKLVEDFPNIPDYRLELSQTLNNLGLLRQNLPPQRPKEAEADFRRALELQAKLAADFPESPEYRARLAETHLNLGLLLERSKPAEADASYAQARVALDKILADLPTVPEFQSSGGRVIYIQATRALAKGKPAEARTLLESAIKQHRAALAAHERNRQYRTYLGDDLGILAVTLLSLGDREPLAAAANDLAQNFPDDPSTALRAAAFLARCVDLASKDTKLPEADRGKLLGEHVAASVDMLRKAFAKGYKNTAILDASEFIPLRDRPEFAALKEELKKPAKG